jgi:hypothetical protein
VGATGAMIHTSGFLAMPCELTEDDRLLGGLAVFGAPLLRPCTVLR